jgi:hypothetical protein
MSCGLSGRNDSTDVVVTPGHNHEQDVSVRHSEDLDPLLAVGEPRVDFFQTVRIFESRNGIRKIHAVLSKVIGSFAIVPIRTARVEGAGYR